MSETRQTSRCPECNVPEIFTKEHIWLSNGDIVARSNQRAHLAFIECENLDPLFTNIGDIIGMPIERLIINIVSRGIRAYLAAFIPDDMKSLLLSMKPGDVVLRQKCRDLIDSLNVANTMLAGIMGCGKYEVKGYRYERDQDDFSTIWVTEPYSVPFVVGTHAGHNAALVGGDRRVDHKEISPSVYELTSHWAPGEKALRERLRIGQYEPKEGDIELERCGTCGGPTALSGYEWHLDRGIILSTLTGRRMAILGPSMLDPVFEALEYELGDIIPHAVIEAQRRFVKTGFYSVDEVQDEENVRNIFATRGLGNLKEIKMGRKGVRARIDNTCLHLMLIGQIQGLFDMAFNIDSHVEWEISEEGNLTVEISP